MLRLFFAAAVVAAAYKIGENKARLDTLDFFLTQSIEVNNVISTVYASVNSQGQIDFSPDMNLGTVLNYFDAMNLKGLIKKYAPSAALKIETVSTIITAQQN